MYTVRKKDAIYRIYKNGALTVYWFNSRKSARRFINSLVLADSQR